jgi:2-keto-4-pentenoate hydratase/2-oxohepta-3-ene-1,7-dioic acid hydratase in catechol pathway
VVAAHILPVANHKQGEEIMKRVIGLLLGLGIVSALLGQGQSVAFKLGTFQAQARTFVGIVLRDSVVVDFAAASRAITPASNVALPTDMKDLIARYNTGLRERIIQVAQSVNAQTGARPAYVYDVKAVKTMPPIMYPTTMLNVAVNYSEHGAEMAARDGNRATETPQGSALPGTKSAPGIWERKASDMRWNPYMFLKASTAVIAHGESIQIPVGRTEIDWECELGVVIGRSASRVSAAAAKNYIFGYTIENDVSDRGGRGDTRFSGSDWLIGKSHDTFAPLGPFIVPSEFVANPQKLPIKVLLNGKPFQEGSSVDMIHDVYEQVEYASNIMTLRPGDVIATGTPAGVGSARKPPVFLKAGDSVSCTYEGIGTLVNPAVGASASGR